MRAFPRFLALIMLPFVAIACSSNGVETSSDVKPGVNFGQFQTFSWVGEHPLFMSSDVRSRISPLFEGRVMNMVQAEFSARGITYVSNPATADIVVGMHIGARDKVDVRTYPTGYYGGGYYGRYGRYYGGYWGGTQTTVRNYVEGSLSIDVFDRAKDEPVWHGQGMKKIYSSTGPMSDDQLRQAVADIMAAYPIPLPAPAQ